MGRPRAFDWDEAQRLRAEGLPYSEIATRLGVSSNSVARACDANFRRRQYAKCNRLLESYRNPCRGGCGVLVTYRGLKPTSGYCPQCFNAKKVEARDLAPQHGTESEYSRGCRCLECRRAATEAKKQRRIRSRVPCVHGCGTLVDSINRRDSNKPPECAACSFTRIRSTLRAEGRLGRRKAA